MRQHSQLWGWPGLSALAAICFGAAASAQDYGRGWGMNSFGVPGLIDMPAALGREDAEVAFSISHFRNQTRNALTFQISDRLSASFRYALLYEVRPQPGDSVVPHRYDRSFSLHYRFLDEGDHRPALALGINDIVGTGIYGGEYVVASKTFSPQWRGTFGIGWGRLGSFGSFSNPLGGDFRTRARHSNGLGGGFEPKTWFHGDAAFFGGLEWRPTERLRLVAEYSSDDYAREDGAAFTRRSPLNFGVDYRSSDRTTLSARYLYGSEIGLQFSYALNPKRPRHGSGLDKAPPPVVPRAALAGQAPDLVDADLPAALRRALAAEGLSLSGLERDGATLRVQIDNARYAIAAQALGRTARLLTGLAPEAVERFDIRLAANGMPVTSVVLRRADLEELEFHPVAPDLMRARSRITDAPVPLAPDPARYPAFTWGLDPYLTPSFFDPDSPLRADAGAALSLRVEPMAGLVIAGKLHRKLVGNLDKTIRPSTSVLPHVRSDGYLYAKGGDTSVPELTAAWYFRPGQDLFGRVTAGYLETMYGGVSTELLWKPQNSRLALGAELNYVRQRAFDEIFGFADYATGTGHVSAYYQFDRGYYGQLDVGRYLAGDLGATLTLAREFDNGWKIGAFATLTDVSARDFGEGSFDKGITLTIPIDWITGKPDRRAISTTIRPVQRDGGARLNVPGRLYETVRGQQASTLGASWGRFWR